MLKHGTETSDRRLNSDQSKSEILYTVDRRPICIHIYASGTLRMRRGLSNFILRSGLLAAPCTSAGIGPGAYVSVAQPRTSHFLVSALLRVLTASSMDDIIASSM